MPIPPTGTVTFLFTDIEGSTRLAQQFPATWPSAKARHHAIVQSAIKPHGGYVFQVIGDAFCAAFHTAPDALMAALDAQHALHTEPWGDVIIRVRMGLHTGSATARPDGDYEGYMALVRVQRIMAGASGGQVLMSQDVADLVGRDLPLSISLNDLGIHRLKGLAAPEHLFQVVAQGLPADFPPLKTADHPNNLPTQLTSFIGRDAEVAEVRRLVSGTRLLTLIGAGGIGKTRLALQAATEEVAKIPDGVWFVELAPLADPALIPNTIASAVGVREEPNRPMLAALSDHFRSKTVLLVLDNCEHLIADAAMVCDSLLRAAPRIKIIVTSREALSIAGETTYRVPSLPVPTNALPLDTLSHVASVQLFAVRAQAAKSSFALTNANALAVVQICHRLDGIPLAIELAAARIKLFTAEQIAARLDDRFRLLTGGSRTAMPRQQTLRGTIDWSFSLLTEPEQALLRRVSVFAGGWYFEAAESVCSEDGIDAIEVLDLLSRLVEKSLVAEDDVHGIARYRLLETIRQYAREKLLDSGDGARVRARHLAYFLRQAIAFSDNWPGLEQTAWFENARTDVDNFRTALDWSFENGDLLSGMRIAGDLFMLWADYFPAEGLDRLGKFLAHVDGQARLAPRASALFAAGGLQSVAGNYAEARFYLEDAVAISKATGSERLAADALGYLTWAAIGLRDYDLADTVSSEALRISREAGIVHLVGNSLEFIGDVAYVQGHLEQAQAAYEEAVTVIRPLGENMLLAKALRGLGQIARRRAEHKQAVEFIRESLTLNTESEDMRAVAECLAALAAVCAAQGHTLVATRVCGAIDAMLIALHSEMIPVDRLEHEQTVTLLRHQLPDSVYDLAWSEGHALTLEQAIALALEGSDV
ncbi:MAG: tetratricopeptide repeat protein [Chloroflexi bacterium]|nr:tetratricopeptide repeat protein [Chloroflexota bacterium]